MATYKVIQDIEAEDKFVGPLSLKQFIFAMAGTFFGWLTVAGVGLVGAWALPIFAPLSLLGFFLAFPWSKDQPTEVWVLAKIKFMFMSKKRIWNQSGQQDLVTVTAPKKVEKNLTKNFSEAEVKSRLKALAETIDSRGWVVKHTTFEEAAGYSATADRLIGVESMQQAVPEIDSSGIPDMLDENGGAVSTKLNAMMQDKAQQHRAEIAEQMEQARLGGLSADQPKAPVTVPHDPGPPLKSDLFDEKLIVADLAAKKAKAGLSEKNLHRIGAHEAKKQPNKKPGKSGHSKSETQSPPTQQPANAGGPTSSSTMTTPVRPDILDLARNNDLNVATIARQAKKSDGGDELVINLH